MKPNKVLCPLGFVPQPNLHCLKTIYLAINEKWYNYNSLANSRYTIAVTAIDHRGEKSYYSDSGASLLVSGYSKNIDPGITTTDLQGSDGYNPEEDYTDGFGGTSSAAPLVSGVIALMLEANPNLTYRDVQHILVETSEQNDSTDSGWSINGAGHEINHKYGFGAVDAAAAVDAAENWTTVEPEIVTTSDEIDVDTAIPDNNGEDLTSTVNIAEDIDLEWAEVVFDAEHTQRGDLEVTLTSPDGTESILAQTHRDPNDNYDRYIFTSARHWDESSLGDWTLSVSDNITGETGTWNSWQLNLYGTDPNSIDSNETQQVTLDYGEIVNRVNFGSQVDSGELPIDKIIDNELNDTENLANNQEELSQEQSRELDLAIEQTDRDFGSSDIGASIGVVNPDGKWTGATGVSNLETQQATETNDLFNIASITKSYTSAVILKLQEQGKLSLDDTFDKWLPEIAAEIPGSEDLTIRQLLNGTGGVWDYFNGDDRFLSDLIADFLSGSDTSRQPEDLVAYAFDKPLYTGGRSTEQWTYPNTGYVIAALIAEEATGKPFEQILTEEILEPLGLENTFFTTEDVDLEQLARGYEDISIAEGSIQPDGVLDDVSFLDSDVAYGAGSIVSTSEDVARFFDALASGELLSPESTAEIFNYVDTGFELDDPEYSREQFGLGVYPKNFPWSETRSMNGAGPGYTSSVDYFLNNDTTISVLLNQSQRAGLVRRAYTASVANTLGLNDESAVNGTEGNDHLAGSSNNDIINGLDGNDTLQGKEGLDAIDGGVGNDSLEGNQGDDILFGKEGEDSLYGGEDNDFINGGVDNDRLYGEAGDDSLVGGDGHDTLNGGADSDVIDGGRGNDELADTEGINSLYGNDGNDLLLTGMGDDTLYGDAGSDVLHSDAGNDQLFGGVGDDELNGGEGNDNLIGGEGNDTITGLSGNDTLAGNEGSDRFILFSEGTDTITDFTLGEDLLELPDNIGFEALEIIQGQGDNADNTLINFESETLSILKDTNTVKVSQADFVID